MIQLVQSLSARSLRGRLLWLMALALLLALGALGVFTMATESEALRRGMREQAQATARSVALAIVNPMLTGQLDVVEQALMRNGQYPGVVSITVIDAGGALVGAVRVGEEGTPKLHYGREPLPSQPPPSIRAETAEVSLGGRTLIEAWSPIAAGSLLGWVRVHQSLDGLAQLREQVLWRVVTTSVLAAMASGLLMMVLLRGPMRSLEAAQRFAIDLSRREGEQMPVPSGGPRETLALVHALNDTSRRLARQDRALRHTVAQLHQRSAVLDERNHQLDAILALSPNGLVAFGQDDCVQFANASFSRLTGLAASELVGLSFDALEARLRALSIDPQAWPGLAACFDAGAGPVRGGDARVLLSLAPPQRRDLHLVGRTDESGSVGRLLSLHDVTMEREVDQMKSEFLSTAAHELRTPMVSIHGFSELLMRRDYPLAQRQSMLQTIHRHSQGMNRILNDLLDLARIDARRGVDFECQRLDLGALMAEAAADLVPPPGREPLVVVPAAGAMPVRGDPGKLRQVLGNLVGNAFKYSPQGGSVQLRILREPDGRAAPARFGFEVCDQGIGMTAEQCARVFERFYRADPSGTVLGTGLGMSIVKEIVELHGGEVTVASELGQGTTVRVWLPAAAATEDPHRTECLGTAAVPG